MKISTKNTEVLCLSTNLRQCTLQVSGNTLQQVEIVLSIGVVFTSDGGPKREFDTRIGKANAVLSLCGHKTGAFKHRKVVSF